MALLVLIGIVLLVAAVVVFKLRKLLPLPVGKVRCDSATSNPNWFTLTPLHRVLGSDCRQLFAGSGLRKRSIPGDLAGILRGLDERHEGGDAGRADVDARELRCADDVL